MCRGWRRRQERIGTAENCAKRILRMGRGEGIARPSCMGASSRGDTLTGRREGHMEQEGRGGSERRLHATGRPGRPASPLPWYARRELEAGERVETAGEGDGRPGRVRWPSGEGLHGTGATRCRAERRPHGTARSGPCAKGGRRGGRRITGVGVTLHKRRPLRCRDRRGLLWPGCTRLPSSQQGESERAVDPLVGRFPQERRH